MIWIGIIIILLMIVSVIGEIRDKYDGFGFLTFVLIVCLLIDIFCYVDYVGCKYKADIINREYNTTYTQDEIFYASDVIEKIQEIKRQRIEVNGDVLNKIKEVK